MHKNFIYIFIASILLSCSSNHETDDLFIKASSLMDGENPDSAYTLLCRIAQMEESLSKSQQMEYKLLKAEAMNKLFIQMDTIKDMQDLLEYYNSHGSETEKIRANYMMGCVFRDKGDAPQALRFYREAVSLADTTSKDCDYRLLSRIYGQIASLFHEQRSPHLELNAEKHAYNYARKVNDTIAAIDYFEHTAGAYRMLNKMDSALLVYQKAVAMYENIGRSDLAAPIKLVSIDIYLRKKNYKRAEENLNYYVTKSGELDKNGTSTSRIPVFFYMKGLYYECVHKMDSALLFYRKSIAEEPVFAENEGAYKGMMSTYGVLNIPDSVCKYARLFAEANDSSNILYSSQEIRRIQSIYNYDENQRIARQKTMEANRYRVTVIAIALILLFLIFIFIVVYIKLTKRRKMQQLSSNVRYSKALEQYNHLKMELDAFIEDADKYRKQKELEIEKLQDVIAVYQDDKQKPDLWNVEQAVLYSNIVCQLHQLASKGKMATSVEWNNLHQIVFSHLSAFYERLQKGQELTEKEINVCIMIRLRFLPSEASILLGLTRQRISNIRNSINMKLFKERGAKTLDINIRDMN